jgi:hypothetical protein
MGYCLSSLWRHAVLTPLRTILSMILWSPFVASLIVTYVSLVTVQHGEPLPFYMWLLMGIELLKVFAFAIHSAGTSFLGISYPFNQNAKFIGMLWIEGLSPLYSRIRTVVLVTHVVAHSITIPMMYRLADERDKAEAAGLEVPVTKTLRIFLDEVDEDQKLKIGFAAALTYACLLETTSLVMIRVMAYVPRFIARSGPDRTRAVVCKRTPLKAAKYLVSISPFFTSFILTFVVFDIAHVENFVYGFFAFGSFVEFCFFSWYIYKMMVFKVVAPASRSRQLLICFLETFFLLYTITRSTLLIAVLLFKGMNEDFAECILPFLMEDVRPASKIVKCYWETVKGTELRPLIFVLITSTIVELVINTIYVLKQIHLYNFGQGGRGLLEAASVMHPAQQGSFIPEEDSEDGFELLDEGGVGEGIFTDEEGRHRNHEE